MSEADREKDWEFSLQEYNELKELDSWDKIVDLDKYWADSKNGPWRKTSLEVFRELVRPCKMAVEADM